MDQWRALHELLGGKYQIVFSALNLTGHTYYVLSQRIFAFRTGFKRY